MVRLQPGRKAIASEPKIGPVVELTRDDLAHLAVRRDPTVLQTLRDNHHRIARAIAAGLSNAEVAQACGISINRVSTLRKDPSMAQLIAEKRAMIDAEFAIAADPVISFLDEIKTKSLSQIVDKLDAAAESGETLPSRDLAMFAELGLDRTGYGKQTKNVNINVDFAAKLEEARRRSERASSLRVVGSSQPVPAIPQPAGESRPVAPQRDRPIPPPPVLRRI
jgi:DNA-binding CsgD family transcriptional regulator